MMPMTTPAVANPPPPTMPPLLLISFLPCSDKMSPIRPQTTSDTTKPAMARPEVRCGP
jgi:hypothetical protein